MGRMSFSSRLTQDERRTLERCVAYRNFANLDAIVSDLQDVGLSISRSAVGRYVKAERERKASLPVIENPTVVSIVDCRTGRSTTIRTSISMESVAEMLSTQPEN